MESTVQWAWLVAAGVAVGVLAGFAGVGGGFLMVPLLLFLGLEAGKSVGTSFLAILIISVAALAAHGRLAHVDWRTGLLLGVGGVAGTQIGAHLLQQVSTAQFRKILAAIMVVMAGLLFVKK